MVLKWNIFKIEKKKCFLKVLLVNYMYSVKVWYVKCWGNGEY